MFGAISKLFKKSERATPVSSSPFAQSTTRGAAPPATGAESPPPRNEAAVITPLPKPSAKRASGEALSIPYSAIIKLVPQELWGKLAPAGVAGYNLTVNRKTVSEQIPFGAVKVSFAELRRGAPSGVFIAGSAEDSRMIDLPLAEILGQLHPDAYARRPNQVRVQVSEEVPDLFGAKGDRLANVRVLEKKAAKDSSHTTSMIRQKVPSAPPAPPAPAQPLAHVPSNITPLPIAPQPAPQPLPAQVPIPAPNLRMPSPAAPAANTPPGTAFIAVRKAPAPAGQQGARPLPKSPAPKVTPAPAAVVPAPTAPVQTSSSVVATANALGFNSQLFLAPLDQIAAGWPAGVRQELAQLKMPDAKIAFPAVEICDGLKRGRVQYPWKTLRTWLQPAPFYATPSPHDEVVIELPLRTITPLFLEFIRANASDRNVASAAGITDFFRRAEASAGTSVEPIRIVEEAAVVAPVAPPSPSVPMAPPVPAPAAQVDCSEAAPPGVAAIENGRLCLPVAQICQAWPEPILRDIQQFSLAGSRIEIPLEQVEAGLKAGRLEYLWKEICVWLRPASGPAQVSINGEVKLPLPLNVVAPMFLKQRDSAGVKKRVSVAESIPDVFSAAGKPVVASSSAAIQGPQSEPEPEPIAETTAPSAPAPAPEPSARKMPATVAELFGELEKKSWTPNEIVQRTATLPNVAGSLIAMQDGLLVAHFMPPTMKTETIAAFVPQIFGRLNQYCKELQMGEARAVSFTVDGGTVHVFNAGIIYFAALSKPGALLPVPELQLIASELSRHTK